MVCHDFAIGDLHDALLAGAEEIGVALVGRENKPSRAVATFGVGLWHILRSNVLPEIAVIGVELRLVGENEFHITVKQVAENCIVTSAGEVETVVEGVVGHPEWNRRD